MINEFNPDSIKTINTTISLQAIIQHLIEKFFTLNPAEDIFFNDSIKWNEKDKDLPLRFKVVVNMSDSTVINQGRPHIIKTEDDTTSAQIDINGTLHYSRIKRQISKTTDTSVKMDFVIVGSQIDNNIALQIKEYIDKINIFYQSIYYGPVCGYFYDNNIIASKLSKLFNLSNIENNNDGSEGGTIYRYRFEMDLRYNNYYEEYIDKIFNYRLTEKIH